MLEARQAHAPFRIVVFNGHVHNYERHEHGGITYFVTGGGGAHAYPIERAADQGDGVCAALALEHVEVHAPVPMTPLQLPVRQSAIEPTYMCDQVHCVAKRRKRRVHPGVL